MIPVETSAIELKPGVTLSSIENEVIGEYYRVFGSKEFMARNSQGLPSFPTKDAYAKEEKSFMKTVENVNVRKLPYWK